MGHEELLDYCCRYKRIICYGAGRYAMTIREFLYENNINLVGFVVTDNKEEKKMLMDLSVDNCTEVFPVKDDTGIIIGVGETKHDEIKESLNMFGVKEYFAVTQKCFNDIDLHTKYIKKWRNNDCEICVLLYHRVCSLPLDVWGLAISPEAFEKQIKFFRENYNIIRFDEDWSKVVEPSLIITFDDGYADNLYHALPILEKYEVPATIFVSTGNLDTSKEFWWDELERIIFFNEKDTFYFAPDGVVFPIRTYEEKKKACQRIRLFLKHLLPDQRSEFLNKIMWELGAEVKSRDLNRSLSKKELRKMASSPLITIGGHTVTHNMLSAEPKDKQEWEIVQSKHTIEETIDDELTVFSYPFGGRDDINVDTIESVKKAGYIRAATTYAGLTCQGKDSFEMPRNSIPYCKEQSEIKKQIKKIYSLY